MKLTARNIMYIQLLFGLISTIYILYTFYREFQRGVFVACR